jgi:ABC-type Fe3+ transport system substrate-binding protein
LEKRLGEESSGSEEGRQDRRHSGATGAKKTARSIEMELLPARSAERQPRQLGDALAKGKLAFALGVSFYTLEGFLNAKLPVKEIPAIKEGLPSSNGSGVIGVVKEAPHPNAAGVFVNWLLSKEGQELYVKVMHQSTRRMV